MIALLKWMRKQSPGIVALAMMVTAFGIGSLPEHSDSEKDELARSYAWDPMSIALPSGFPQQPVRKVNQDYEHMDAWISSVGAGIAMNDIDGDGAANDLCIVDTRIDQVIVTPAPGGGPDRYSPFALDSGPLPTHEHMAPMGCLPGDFNEDGRTDLLAYFWGRTPIIFLARSDAPEPTAASFEPVELVPGDNGTEYEGPLWNTNAVAYDDFDGDGHYDILITNYFPHGPVLNDQVSGGVSMNASMSNAQNGGESYIFLFESATAGPSPSVTYEMHDDALPRHASKGWALGAAANDLDGDGLPELYLANDFGPDNLLYNRSTPGELRFTEVKDSFQSATVPKSKQVGLDSFKGMGIDFADLNNDGLYDMFVSNITTSWGIQESNFHFLNTAADQGELRDALQRGEPTFSEKSADLLTAWSGWGWDAKTADFNNNGSLEIVQANGFVKGEVNRWPQLQELAITNDGLVADPSWWPHVTLGDDIAGHQRLHFYVRSGNGDYANLSAALGLDVPVPTRGVATGDADGDGNVDMAIARQWGQPIYYHNDSESTGAFLGLKLFHDDVSAEQAPGSPVIGAQVTVTLPDGTQRISRVDGGGGHSGKRSNDVHIGLGEHTDQPVQVHLQWRDRTGRLREQDLTLTPGWHELLLGTEAKEK